MENTRCRFQRVSDVVVGTVLLTLGLGFVAIGLTVLPVAGFVLAAPILAVSVKFFSLPRDRECVLAS